MLVVGGGQNQYNLYNSLRFRSSASAYLNRTPASAGNRQIYTWSGWVKRGALNGGGSDMCLFNAGTTSPTYDGFRIKSDTISFFQGGAVSVNIESTQVFRDVSAWYHLVLAVDTTQATASNRVKIYVNGNQVTVFSTANYPAQNAQASINNNLVHNIAAQYANTSSTSFLDGYLTEINFIDGQALPPTAFATLNPATGVGTPLKYTGTYGTNGFYLPFSDTSALTTSSNVGLGKDFSGNSNYWTTNNISITAGVTYDAMTDVPTLTSPTVANYAVLNPTYGNAYAGNVLAANLQINSPTTDGFCPSTIAVSSGKWYYETSMTNSSAASFIYGIVKTSVTNATQELRNVGTGNGYSYLASTGVKSDGSGGAGTAYGATFTTGDVMGCAFDLDAGTITFYKNNVSQGVAYTGISGEFMAAIGDAASGSGGQTAWINFGQRPFAYTPPSGFLALNTFNLPTPTILQGNKYMDATTWTGTGVARSITNAGSFSPDFIWVKQRSSTENHQLVDTVRGYDKYLNSNLTDAEATNTNRVTSFNSNGFSIGTATSVNSNTNTYVGWQWQAGQGSTSSNTQGSITSTISVSTTAGFSVVTYTGTGANATVGHGLGVAPKMIICKNRASATDWAVYHASVGNTGALRLNLTAITETDSRYWNNTTPTSTVFSVGSSSTVNGSSNTQVAYCWAEIAGFSKFGSYVGNGSSDGPFVYLGFRPRWVMWKNASANSYWWIMDSSINPYNPNIYILAPNANIAQYTDSNIKDDFLSNGFKLRNLAGNEVNGNGNTIIYAAFAENPFKNALAR